MTTALAKADPHQMQHRSAVGELTVQDLVDRKTKILRVMESVMREGDHYGKIPGCGDKPTLLKAGAEVLATTFGLAPKFDIKRSDLPNGHREYEVTCRLVTIGSEMLVGEGLGSCSTMESKYRWRKGERTCPDCGKATIIKGKAEYGGGWLCFGKKGGCGAKWKDGDQVIEGQQTDRVENPDIADTYNTVLKMAKKRAQVDATLTAVGASDLLTQDLEDLPPASRDYDKPRNQNQQREQIEDAEFQDLAGQGEAGDTPRGSPTAHEGIGTYADHRGPNPTHMSELERKAAALVEEIDAATSEKQLRGLAPRFNAMPKGTKERVYVHDAYKRKLASFEQQGATA